MAAPKIFLIGIMGAGKTYYAQKLGEYFALPVFDTDVLIEQEAGKTISEIFSQSEGENNFRILERKLIQEKSWPQNCIISCGGGLPCFFDNMEWMLSQGLVIWLNPPVSVIVDRLWAERSFRPLVSACNTLEELEHRIRLLLEKREPYYSKAQIEFTDTTGIAYLINSIEVYLR